MSRQLCSSSFSCLCNTNRGRKRTLLSLFALCLLAFPIQAVLFSPAPAFAQTAPTANKDIVGTWQGTLHIEQANRDLRLVAKIEKNGSGYKATFYSIDQGGQPLPCDSTTLADGTVTMTIERIGGNYQGKLSSDGNTITGTWKQGPNPVALVLQRATPETEWTIPEPPKPIPPMPATADPTFEVATIKPSNPERPGKLFTFRGRRFITINTNLVDMISFAYDVQNKQIVDGPAWIGTDKFDLEAQPDVEGMPNDKQLKSMMKKLLASRFQMKFHEEKRELSAYVLEVAKGGPKMKKNVDDQNGLPGLFFTQLGVLNVHNATMSDFSHLMQAAVLDRPVVDKTGLPDRWNFILKWTPDESQFGGLGMKAPKPTDSPDAPPPLFTALPEQLGLKMDSTKTEVPVMVIDKLEKPSEN